MPAMEGKIAMFEGEKPREITEEFLDTQWRMLRFYEGAPNISLSPAEQLIAALPFYMEPLLQIVTLFRQKLGYNKKEVDLLALRSYFENGSSVNMARLVFRYQNGTETENCAQCQQRSAFTPLHNPNRFRFTPTVTAPGNPFLLVNCPAKNRTTRFYPRQMR